MSAAEAARPEPGRRWLSPLFFVLLIGVAVTAWSTAQAARDAVLDSQSGSISAVALDPTAAGFRAFTEPTPTALVLHTAIDDETSRPELTGVTFMAGADADRGGTLVTIPSTFVAPDLSDQELGILFETSGFDAVVSELEGVLRIGFGEVVVLDGRSWTTLMTEDLPLPITLREDLVEEVDGGGTQLVLAGGTRDFRLDEVELMASHRNPGEVSLALADRQQEVWRAWISRTASLDERPELFAVQEGFITLIDDMARGEVSYRTVPFSTLDAGDGRIQYLARRADIDDLVSRIVPFPRSAAPGDRPAVMLLDGTGGRLPQADVLAAVVSGGGQVAILGNADRFDLATTEIQVHDAAAVPVAREIAARLGAAPPVEVPLSEATVSITVIAGADQRAGP